jgi:hypothetical protein
LQNILVKKFKDINMKIKITEETRKKWENLLPVEYRIGLNSYLIQSKDLDRTDVGIIFGLHGQKLFLFNEAKNFLQKLGYKGEIKKDDIKNIKRINDILEDLEFAAQEAWGFDRDSDFHNWWMDLPGCRCPVMDNHERSGIPGYIYVEDCPWHGALIGGFDKKLKEI